MSAHSPAPAMPRTWRARPLRRAFVTFLMFSDSYLPGALMAAYGLQRQGSHSDRVCLVTDGVSPKARAALSLLYTRVVRVDPISVPGCSRGAKDSRTSTDPRTGSARERSAALTRFAALRLGLDGGLGCDYDKIVSLDADLLPLRDFEALWDVPAPAGIVNESRSHMAQFDDLGRLVPCPDAAGSGEWVWHDVYRDTAPPGALVPREITDRVATDPLNYGVNASLLVLEPARTTYDDVRRWVSREPVRTLVRDRWPWTDQQAATLYWSGRWTSLDPSYSLLYGYPSLEIARGLHYAGIKPWAWRTKGFSRRIERFPDYALWSRTFTCLMNTLPALRRHSGLAQLERATRDSLGAVPRRHLPCGRQ